MRLQNGSPAFCIGCEFSGQIPAGASVDAYCMLKNNLAITSARHLIDSEYRVSNGMLDKENLDVAPGGDFIAQIIRECDGEQCELEENGLVPVEITEEHQRLVIEGWLNTKAGIKALGGVTLTSVNYEGE